MLNHPWQISQRKRPIRVVTGLPIVSMVPGDIIKEACQELGCNAKIWPHTAMIAHKKWHKLHDKDFKEAKKHIQDQFKIIFKQTYKNDSV